LERLLPASLSDRPDSLYSITSVCSVDFAKADVCGEIEFAIRYNFKFGILEICISACKNLAYGKEEKKKYLSLSQPTGKVANAFLPSTNHTPPSWPCHTFRSVMILDGCETPSPLPGKSLPLNCSAIKL
uniref:Uncharacterized protein n=1 Tax=Naja naja TaxID=35670 RepID=A0A8C6V7F7_NAJNA